MTADKWVIHPGTVIAHHAGHYLAARLSCAERPVPVTRADIVLLAMFRVPASPAEAVAEFASGAGAPFLPGRPVLQQVHRRVQELQQRRVLVPGGLHSAVHAEAVLRRGDFDGAAAGKGRFRLSRNFGLRPCTAGFRIRSAATGETCILDLELALLLLAFADGRTVAEAGEGHRPGVSLDQLRAIAAGFAQRGLLIPLRDHSRAAGDYRRQVPLRRCQAPSWRDMRPDGRIPVYFVPHMENHFPLALGMIYSALDHWRAGRLRERFQLIPISYLPPQQFLDGPYRKFGRGVWLFSNYMWSLPLNLRISAAIKQHDAGNLTIHGGPSTPSYEQACAEFMRRHPSVDIAVHGEGEITTCEILAAVERDPTGMLRPGQAMADVAGLTYRRTGNSAPDLVRTAPRMRMGRLDVVPSPYTAGVFDAYEAHVEAAIIETNRGCPFKCTFCDWGSATNQKVAKFDLERVRAELEWIGRNRIGVLWIADANFGMLKRDLEIAEQIIAVKRRYGYPREVVVNYTKNANERLAEIIKVFTAGGIISQGIISIQTTDARTLEIIDRSNIKTEKYDQLIEIFSALGLPLSTDLMIGLPGITPEAFDRDLQRYIDVDVSVKAYPTQLLPNSPMAHPDYMREHRIEVDADGFLVSCASYTAEDLRSMNLIYHVYTAADGYGALRHVLRFLQWEHGIRAIDLMHELAALAYETPERFPAISWVVRQFVAEKCIPGGWQQFFDEIAAFVEERHGIPRDPAFDVVLQVNELVMPDDARTYPLTVELPHDYERYFADHNRRRTGPVTPLRNYPPGRLTVSDPNGMANIDFEYQQYDTHQFFWELHSPVSRPKSIADEASREASSPVAN